MAGLIDYDATQWIQLQSQHHLVMASGQLVAIWAHFYEDKFARKHKNISLYIFKCILYTTFSNVKKEIYYRNLHKMNGRWPRNSRNSLGPLGFRPVKSLHFLLNPPCFPFFLFYSRLIKKSKINKLNI